MTGFLYIEGRRCVSQDEGSSHWGESFSRFITTESVPVYMAYRLMYMVFKWYF